MQLQYNGSSYQSFKFIHMVFIFFLSSYGYVYLNINISYPYFSIQFTYKAYCSEGYYGADCSAYCPGNPRKCVVNGHTYCKMGTFIYTSKIILKNSV